MTWLIGLVAATADAEAIAGDLDEERQALALRHGRPAASAWYWRQVVRTVAHLVVSPIRQAPFRFVALGVLGFALIVPLTGVAVWVAGAIVLRVPVYYYIPATSFWLATSVVPHLLVGIVSGLVMGSRAMAAAVHPTIGRGMGRPPGAPRHGSCIVFGQQFEGARIDP